MANAGVQGGEMKGVTANQMVEAGAYRARDSVPGRIG